MFRTIAHLAIDPLDLALLQALDRLAHRTASCLAQAIALTEASACARKLPTSAGMIEGAHYFSPSVATPPAGTHTTNPRPVPAAFQP